jgi:hypothetical protein
MSQNQLVTKSTCPGPFFLGLALPRGQWESGAARAHSTTLRARQAPPGSRQVLECVRASAALAGQDTSSSNWKKSLSYTQVFSIFEKRRCQKNGGIKMKVAADLHAGGRGVLSFCPELEEIGRTPNRPSQATIISDFQGSATVSVVAVGIRLPSKIAFFSLL